MKNKICFQLGIKELKVMGPSIKESIPISQVSSAAGQPLRELAKDLPPTAPTVSVN